MNRFLSVSSKTKNENNLIAQPVKDSEFNKLIAALNESDSFKSYKALQVLSTLASHFSALQTETVTKLIFEKFKNEWDGQNRPMWKGGIQLLGSMAPNLAKESIKCMYLEIIEKLENEPLFFRDCRDIISTTISQIIHMLSDSEVSKLYSDILTMMKKAPDDSYEVASPLIVSMLPKLSSPQIQTILDLLEPKLHEDNDWYIQLTARVAYADIFAEKIITKLNEYETEAELRAALEPIISKLKDKNFIPRLTALQSLLSISEEITDGTKLDLILEQLMPLLKDKDANVRYQTLLGLNKMVFKLSSQQILQLFTPVLNRLNPYEDDETVVCAATLLNKMSSVTKLPRIDDHTLEVITQFIINSQFDFVEIDPDSLKCFNLLAPIFEPDQLNKFLQPLKVKLSRLQYPYQEADFAVYSEAVSALTTDEVNAIFDTYVRDHLTDLNGRYLQAINIATVLAPRLSGEQALYYYQYLLSEDANANPSTEVLQVLGARLPKASVNEIAAVLYTKIEGEKNKQTDNKYLDLFLGILPQLNIDQISTAFDLLLPKLSEVHPDSSHALKLLTAMAPNLTRAQVGSAITALYSRNRYDSLYYKLEDTFIQTCLDLNKCTLDQLDKANVHNDPNRILLICQASWACANKHTSLNKNSFFMSQNQTITTNSQVESLYQHYNPI